MLSMQYFPARCQTCVAEAEEARDVQRSHFEAATVYVSRVVALSALALMAVSMSGLALLA